jgi:hypothetical protein
MTLILAINGKESIWLLADRRLSSKSRPVKDDARKVMFLETSDGTAILGYAGLGATSLGTEPSDWMSAVLRGRNLPLEHCLGILAEALKNQLPRHMIKIPRNIALAHNVVITAFVNNQVRLYTIDLVFADDRKSYNFRFTRHEARLKNSPLMGTPRIFIAGSGSQYLLQDKKWIRNLLFRVNAYDRRKVSQYVVSDYLAALNNEVHLGLCDKSVGPRCIIAWRCRTKGIHKGGGGHQFYTGTSRDNSSLSLPTISGGMDIKALCDILMPSLTQMSAAMQAGKNLEEFDKDNINTKLANLPNKPDENLL